MNVPGKPLLSTGLVVCESVALIVDIGAMGGGTGTAIVAGVDTADEAAAFSLRRFLSLGSVTAAAALVSADALGSTD